MTSNRNVKRVMPGLAVMALLIGSAFTGLGQEQPQWTVPLPGDAGCKQLVPCSKANQFLLRQAAGIAVRLSPSGGYPQGEDVIDVRHYELRFKRIDFTTHEVEAEAILTIRAVERLDTEVVLDFGGFTLSSVAVNDVATTYTRAGENAAKLHVALPAPVAADDTVRVSVSYFGVPAIADQLGFVFTVGAGGKQLACTMAEPNGAHLWFPCNDRPDDKATLDLYATVEDGRLVASNGGLLAETLAAGMRTFHWQELHPISTYLIVMNAGDFTRVDVGGGVVPISGWFIPTSVASGTTGLNLLPGQLATFSDMFGPYPFDKYGHAEFPNFNYGGMEHQSLTTLHSGYLKSRSIIAHELGHMWWGDLVGPATWDDLWLNEGFATYSESLEKAGRNRDAIGVTLSGSIDWSRPLNRPDYNNLFSNGLVYYRGAWTLHHLRSYLGEEKFWPALLHYRQRYAFSNATTDDLRQAFEASSGVALDSWFNRFVYNSGRPAISLCYYAEKRLGLGGRVLIRYKRTDGFACADVVFIRLNFVGGQSRIVRCPWLAPETCAEMYDDRDVTSIEFDPLHDYSGGISTNGTLIATNNDGDTLPDGWELAMLGTTAYTDMDDPDGDGFTNAEEYLADTHPADAMSAPRIASVRLSDDPSGKKVQLNCKTSVFAHYTLQRTNHLEDQPVVWTDVAPKTRGTGETITWSQSLDAEPHAFYRMRIDTQ